MTCQLISRKSLKRIGRKCLFFRKTQVLYRSQWYSTFDTDEDRITKNNCSDIWSGLEIEKFKRDLEKEGSSYGKQEKRYKNSENKY